MLKTVITGSGSYIPTNIIEGSHFLQSEFYTDEGEKIEKPVEEIIKKFVDITEIERRRYIDKDMVNSDMGKIAAEEAIKDAGIDKESIDYIICATNFGEVDNNGLSSFMPSISARVKHKLGITNRTCITYDMLFGCPGWVESLSLADTLIKAGKAKTILVMGSETLSRVTDPYDRNKMIFADGAGAVIVQARENVEEGVVVAKTFCDNGDELCFLETSPSINKDAEQHSQYIRMRGRKIYEYALKYVPDAVKQTLDAAGLTINDVDKILIHQANAKMDHAMLSRIMKLYGITEYDDSIAPMTIQDFGNSSVATVPTMYDLIAKGNFEGQSFKKGGYIVFTSVGAGMNINCVVYKNPN